jgi:hypothetical protein
MRYDIYEGAVGVVAGGYAWTGAPVGRSTQDTPKWQAGYVLHWRKGKRVPGGFMQEDFDWRWLRYH